MGRSHITEVFCDFCGCAIGHYHRGPGKSITSLIRQGGGIVSQHGDFCDKNCLDVWIKANKPPRPAK